MKKRWRMTLPVVGLLLFGVITHHAVRWNLEMHTSQYFWWSAIRLNKDPLNRRPKPVVLQHCQGGDENCVSWNPEFIWVEPGLLPGAFLLSAFPAFAVGDLLVRILGKLGVNELTTFLSAIPLLLARWYFLLGWFFDWLGYRWRRRRQSWTDAVPQS